MRELSDEDIGEMLKQVQVPEPRADLQERIITTAMAQGKPAVEVKTGRGFSAWWGGLRAEHGTKLAIAASLAAVAVIVFDPAGHIAERYIGEQQVAAVEAVPSYSERYTVDGVPLLADITLVEEPDLEMDLALAGY